MLKSNIDRLLGKSSRAPYLTSALSLGLSRRLLPFRSLSQTLRRDLGIGALKNIAFVHSKLASVIAISLQISPEACILELNSILADVWKAEYSEGS